MSVGGVLRGVGTGNSNWVSGYTSITLIQKPKHVILAGFYTKP